MDSWEALGIGMVLTTRGIIMFIQIATSPDEREADHGGILWDSHENHYLSQNSVYLLNLIVYLFIWLAIYLFIYLFFH